MVELRNLLIETIQSIEWTTEMFYRQKTEQGYNRLENTLVLLTHVMNAIYAYKLEGHDIGIEEKQLVQVLAESMKAMEVKDTILLSDILQYDLKEMFDKVLASL